MGLRGIMNKAEKDALKAEFKDDEGTVQVDLEILKLLKQIEINTRK